MVTPRPRMNRCYAGLLGLVCLFAAGAALAQEDGANPLDPANGDAANPNAAQLADAQTSYIGARLLCAPEDISPDCSTAARGQVSFDRIEAGDWADDERRERYAYWQGDSLFVGVIDQDGHNSVNAIVEFFWFESSVERDSDFYVAVLKVVSAPPPTTNWRIATPPSFTDQILLRDIGPAQRVRATMHTSGDFGAIRADWSVPFLNYRWEPERVIEVEQQYNAGVNAEGTAMKSLTEGVNIQAKGFFNANTKVSTRYTITLWRWEMRVQPSPVSMTWHLTALDPEHERDPAYHEYFLVIQARRGEEARLEALDFGATFRERRGGLLDGVIPDQFHDVSVRISDIVLRPPLLTDCPEGFVETEEGCTPNCPAGSKPTNGECVRDCPDGFISRGGYCVKECQDGYEADGDRCVSVCGDDERYVGGRCVPLCGEGERIENNTCVPVCGEGQKQEGNRCVSACRDGEQFIDGRCESLCEADEQYVDGDCVRGCPDDAVLENGRCVPTDCPDGEHIDETSGRCVRNCGPGFKPVGNGRCVIDCPPGMTEMRGRCVQEDDCSGVRANRDDCDDDGYDNDRVQRSIEQRAADDSDNRTKAAGITDDTDEDFEGDGMSTSAQGGCNVPGEQSQPLPWLLVACLALLGRRRRS